MNVIHRDLSMNNIIYDRELDSLKIIDFTTAKIIPIVKSASSFKSLLTNNCTLHVKSPEMLNREVYGKSIDVWAIGVNLFSLYFGSLPFDADSDKQIIEDILTLDPFDR